MDSQVTLVAWPCFSLTEKQCTVNHLIILVIQSVSYTKAAFKAFAMAYLYFLVSAPAKKNAEAIKFLGTLKNMPPRVKYIFV